MKMQKVNANAVIKMLMLSLVIPMGVSTVMSAEQIGKMINPAVQEDCGSLPCSSPSDCGSSCFCNGPLASCFVN